MSLRSDGRGSFSVALVFAPAPASAIGVGRFRQSEGMIQALRIISKVLLLARRSAAERTICPAAPAAFAIKCSRPRTKCAVALTLEFRKSLHPPRQSGVKR